MRVRSPQLDNTLLPQNVMNQHLYKSRKLDDDLMTCSEQIVVWEGNILKKTVNS
jgi:hypothetical protein